MLPILTVYVGADGDQLFPKPVFDAGWHQDLFRGVIPSEVISACKSSRRVCLHCALLYSSAKLSVASLIQSSLRHHAGTAIDAATATNGALHYVPGSHRWGHIDDIGGPPFWLSAGNNPSNNKGSREPLPRGAVAARDDAEADDAWRMPVSFELEPGDVAFHHCLTLHTSGHVVNPATVGVPLPRRRGYSVHYMRASSIIQSAGAAQIGNGNPLTGQGQHVQIRGRSFEGRV
jgi:ectoine hydroxylase-related dioxygenase (phytanoyl-CoA dioxygenase family)